MDRRRASETMTSASNWIPKELTTEQIQELKNVLIKLGFKVYRKSNHSTGGSTSNILKKRKSRSCGNLEESEYIISSHKSNISITSPHTSHLSPNNSFAYNNNNKKKMSHQSVPSQSHTLKHQRSTSALPTIINATTIMANTSQSTIIHYADQHENDRKEQMKQINKLKIGSPSSHKKSNTILGLPPPSSWEFDEDDDNEHEENEMVRIKVDGYQRDKDTIVEYDIQNYQIPKDLQDIEEDGDIDVDVDDNDHYLPPQPTQIKQYGHSEGNINVNRAPPPLPKHIQQQFKRNGHSEKYGKSKPLQMKRQRSATSPVASPISPISPLSPPEDMVGMDDDENDDNDIFPKTPSSLKPRHSRTTRMESNKSGSRVSEIIARFNYINIPITSSVNDEQYIE